MPSSIAAWAAHEVFVFILYNSEPHLHEPLAIDHGLQVGGSWRSGPLLLEKILLFLIKILIIQ